MWQLRLRPVRTPAANRLSPSRNRRSNGEECSRAQCNKIENSEAVRGSGIGAVRSHAACVGPGNDARDHVAASECTSAGTEERWYRAALEPTDSAWSHVSRRNRESGPVGRLFRQEAYDFESGLLPVSDAVWRSPERPGECTPGIEV